LVDDDSDIVDLFKEILESYDYVVNGFTSPLEALQHFQTYYKQYGLVVSDIRMPEMNGFDLLKNIKKFNATVSFYLMSAYDTVDFSELQDVKIDGFIQKPIQIKKLLSIIEKNLEENLRNHHVIIDEDNW